MMKLQTTDEHSGRATQKYQKASNAQILKQYNENQKFWQMISLKANSLYTAFAKILPYSYIGGFYATFYQINAEHTERFFDQLCTGKNIENSAIEILRHKLLNDKMSSTKKMTPNTKIGLMIKSWNYFRKGINIKLLTYDFAKDGDISPL